MGLKEILDSGTGLIREAAKSTLGIIALVVAALAVLAATFFSSAPDEVKLAVFGILVLAAILLVPSVLGRSRNAPDAAEPTAAEQPAETVEPAASPHPEAPEASSAGSRTRYRVVGFDLDGTLLRGLEFSWTLVWNFLEFPDYVRKAGMRRYISRQTTYQEWCEWACTQFREKGLKREDFRTMCSDITVTKSLRQALALLRADGFRIGLISGGIDVLLYEMIPDADELFDDIYINRLEFDAKGVISGVQATEHDFEGKAVALREMCEARGCSMAQSVFVGEGFNDSTVAAQAGLAIAYPPTDQGMRAAAVVEIKDDDLMKVVAHILRS